MLATLIFAQLVATSCSFSDAKQLVVVVTKTWSDDHGVLETYEREGVGASARWVPRVTGEPIFVGKRGLGWGRGLDEGKPFSVGPTKREGDHRSPAGLFSLGAAFGTALPDKLAVPTEPAVGQVCVDDPRSARYNQRFAPGAEKRDWRSAENLEMYSRAVVVEHNRDRQRGAGSCVFLHDGAAPTPGCSAGPSWLLDKLLAWLRADQCPVLVQLPLPQYQTLAARLHLPQLSLKSKAICEGQ